MRPLFAKRQKGRVPAMVKLKRALLRIRGDGTRESFKLVERVFKAIRELRNV